MVLVFGMLFLSQEKTNYKGIISCTANMTLQVWYCSAHVLNYSSSTNFISALQNSTLLMEFRHHTTHALLCTEFLWLEYTGWVKKTDPLFAFVISWLPRCLEKWCWTFFNSSHCAESKNSGTFILGLKLGNSYTK